MTNADNILLRHNYISLPATGEENLSSEVVATILMNLSYYGRSLDTTGYRLLTKANKGEVADWWLSIERELKALTGANRKMADFVVYKNFPKEVLNKTESEYWTAQILMYWGFPDELFTEKVEPRAKMKEQPRCTVVKVATKDTLKSILSEHLKNPARWKEWELEEVLFLVETQPFNLASLAFKENMVTLATHLMQQGKTIKVNTATDVLRLAAGLSDGDVSLRTNTKFKSFKKPVRRFLLNMLEGCANLADDAARRPELFKRLVHQLHPGDYKRRFPHVISVLGPLYRDELATFNSTVEHMLEKKNAKVLGILAERPGEMRRRLVHLLELFGNKAANAFSADKVLDKLTPYQLVATRTFLETANNRLHRVFPPKGNWNRLQIGEARWVEERHVKTISKAIGKQLAARLPKVGVLDDATHMVKLPNSGEEGPYARGTTFPIPEDVKFIRSASYWKVDNSHYTWYDNGWNFFDTNWKTKGSCCWITPSYPNNGRATWGSLASRKSFKDAGAIFSGDPTVSAGRATQMIDLYPDKLKAEGVRYCVWNILCFSRLKFSQAEDVFAALQWGADAETGKLFEPSRAQVTFPVKGETFTKYIVLIDLWERKMVFLDANLKGNTSSAESNCKLLEDTMPAVMEYIQALPSVHDLFRDSVDDQSDTHILYSDKDATLDGESAYVFRPENKSNKYKAVDLNGLLT